MIQVYSMYSRVVTNILSGVQFEQGITLEPNFISDLELKYKFTLNKTLLFVPGDATLLTPNVSGDYEELGLANTITSLDSQFIFVDKGITGGGQESNSHFIIPASTLTDDDFLSVWQASNGNTFEYIGTSTVVTDPQITQLTFRGIDADVAPNTGILTHVSGGVNTGNQTYVNYDNSFNRWRWALYWDAPPVPFIQKYIFVAPLTQGLASDESLRDTLFSALVGSVGNFKLAKEQIFSRVLTTAVSFDGNPTFDIPTDDIVSSNGRYTKVIGLDYQGFIIHDGHQLEKDKYGRFFNDAANYAGQYFIKPIVASTGQMIALKLSEWTESSLWILYTPALQIIQNAGNQNYFLNNAYKLSSIIRTLIQEIDPSLTYDEDILHSEFFNSINPIRGDIKTPILATKTSVISGNYDKPARKTTVRFRDIEELLKNFYQCYWYIDDSNRFRVEFIDYFDRGLTYTGQNINDDLTTLLEPKTGKPWGYADKKYKFEKSEMPEQITFSWMDETSTPFDGVPIELTSPYVEKGNLDLRTISHFTSDIDFIHSQTSSINPDGFVLFEATIGPTTFEVPFLSLVVDGDTFNLQNGYASMFFAAVNYWLFDLPSLDINLNYVNQQATTIRKTKLQDVETPSTNEPDPMKLEISSIGTGSINKMTINLSTGMVKLNLRHVTE